MSVTQEQIGEVISTLLSSSNARIFALSQNEILNEWQWIWEEDKSKEWNAYWFFCALERYKNRCRKWEEHHGGSYCVVERVRDKYLMPRVSEFLVEFGRRGGIGERQGVK